MKPGQKKNLINIMKIMAFHEKSFVKIPMRKDIWTGSEEKKNTLIHIYLFHINSGRLINLRIAQRPKILT